MKTYLNYLLESSYTKYDKTIAIIAGSYKPPTAGHLYMVEHYSKIADDVIVLISNPQNKNSMRITNLGTVITPEMSKQIWDIYVERYKLPNIKILISNEPSPIKSMCKYIDDELKDVNVILGTSTKDNNNERYEFATKYYANNSNINLLNPIDTAIEPYKIDDEKIISAADVRNNIDNPELIKTMLPNKLIDTDIDSVIKILQSGKKLTESNLDCSLEPLDETESIHLSITDELLSTAKICAYNIGQVITNDDGDSEIPYNPKKFPDKAVTITITIDNVQIEIFLNTKTKMWDSSVLYKNQKRTLTPDQMEEFFTSNFYNILTTCIAKKWPLSDKFFNDLYHGLTNKTLSLAAQPLAEDNENDNKDTEERKFTAGGRKIITFSDNNTTTKKSKFFCWPNKKHPFKWSQWKDWKKIKPLCRIRFFHRGIPYGISLSTICNDYKNRGFRGYSLDPTLPPVQWLTSEENQSIMKLTIVNKFIKQCIKQIQPYIDMSPEEIFEKINEPERITLQEVAKTHSCIRHTLNEIIKKHQVDNFKWD